MRRFLGALPDAANRRVTQQPHESHVPYELHTCPCADSRHRGGKLLCLWRTDESRDRQCPLLSTWMSVFLNHEQSTKVYEPECDKEDVGRVSTILSE